MPLGAADCCCDVLVLGSMSYLSRKTIIVGELGQNLEYVVEVEPFFGKTRRDQQTAARLELRRLSVCCLERLFVRKGFHLSCKM